MLIIVTLKVSMDIPYKFLNLHNKSSLDSYKKGNMAVGVEGEEQPNI
jgi:hypothetical protein